MLSQHAKTYIEFMFDFTNDPDLGEEILKHGRKMIDISMRAFLIESRQSLFHGQSSQPWHVEATFVDIEQNWEAALNHAFLVIGGAS